MDARFARAHEGIAALSLPQPVVQGALANLRRWLTEPAFSAYLPQIEAMLDQGRFDVLADAFYQVVPFGTGGRRGAVGVGPNRINRWTIGTSVQGHADWLVARHGRQALGVVIAYDVRRFEDVEHIWDPERPNPVLGLSSRDLAELAACIYAANGIDAWILPREADRFMSTPELSFAVRALGAAGGLNLSASHNPPDDNGIKVYDARGSQLIPPDDQELMRAVQTVASVQRLEWEEAVESGRVRWIPEVVHTRYIETCAALATPQGPRAIGVLYTPLHGTGRVDEALAAAGFQVQVLAAQAEPDSRFSTVPGGVPNPEHPEVLQLALEQAGPEIDLVLATDPDADRIGAVCRHQGRWVHLSGNELAVLLVDHLLKRPTARTPLIIKTEVTSTLVERVALSRGARVIGDLLVGFKYIGEGLRALEEDGSFRGIRADEVQFVAGVEESNGVLLTDAMRDKDAAGGAVVLTEAAAAARLQGRTLVDVLDELKQRHGYVRNTQLTLRFDGVSGQAILASLLGSLRVQPPRAFGDRRVQEVIDHADPEGRFGPLRSETDAASRNVLVMRLSDGPHDEGGRIILRPSGTEPKLKVYLEVLGRPGLGPAARAKVDAALAALGEAVHEALTVPQG